MNLYDAGRPTNIRVDSDHANVPTLLDATARVIWYIKSILGDFPWDRYSLVESFPTNKGAIGYSAPGFLALSEDAVKYHEVAGWAPEFLPHEIAHQWFPIEVTLARQEDGLLAEGLAEYLAWRYLREAQPEQAQLMVQRAMRDALQPEPLRPLSLGLKLFAVEPWDITHRTLYQRGLLVFRTLETVIGRERVDRVLREYYKRFAGRSAGIADFRKVCEEISQRDLGWFFDYYVKGTEIPEFALRRLPSSQPNEYLGEVVVKNVPPDFQVRVEMKFFTSIGVVENSVALRGEMTPISMNLPAPLERVVLDPDLRILRWTEAARRNREQQKLLAQLGERERQGDFAGAAKLCEEALALDPEDLAANQQLIRFQSGRILFRQKQWKAALAEFQRVLESRSIAPMDAEFDRAWARVYRAKILRAQGQLTAARREAEAGLALAAPALDSAVAWPEANGKETTARNELKRFLAAQGKK